MFVRAVVWRTLLRDRPSYRDTLLSLGEGYLLNNFLPFRLGEIGRAFMLSRRSGMSFSEILPTIVIERAVDLFFTRGRSSWVRSRSWWASAATGRIAVYRGRRHRAGPGRPVRPGAQPTAGAWTCSTG